MRRRSAISAVLVVAGFASGAPSAQAYDPTWFACPDAFVVLDQT